MDKQDSFSCDKTTGKYSFNFIIHSLDMGEYAGQPVFTTLTDMKIYIDDIMVWLYLRFGRLGTWEEDDEYAKKLDKMEDNLLEARKQINEIINAGAII